MTLDDGLVPEVGGPKLRSLDTERHLKLGVSVWIPKESRVLQAHDGPRAVRYGIIIEVETIDGVTTDSGPMLRVTGTASNGSIHSEDYHRAGTFLGLLEPRSGLRTPEMKLKDINTARDLVIRFLEAMEKAGFPGASELSATHRGWRVGTLQPPVTRVVDRGDHTGNAAVPPRELLLLTNGCFATQSEGVHVVEPGHLRMPAHSVDPWSQLTTELPRIAAEAGVQVPT